MVLHLIMPVLCGQAMTAGQDGGLSSGAARDQGTHAVPREEAQAGRSSAAHACPPDLLACQGVHTGNVPAVRARPAQALRQLGRTAAGRVWSAWLGTRWLVCMPCEQDCLVLRGWLRLTRAAGCWQAVTRQLVCRWRVLCIGVCQGHDWGGIHAVPQLAAPQDPAPVTQALISQAWHAAEGRSAAARPCAAHASGSASPEPGTVAARACSSITFKWQWQRGQLQLLACDSRRLWLQLGAAAHACAVRATEASAQACMIVIAQLPVPSLTCRQLHVGAARGQMPRQLPGCGEGEQQARLNAQLCCCSSSPNRVQASLENVLAWLQLRLCCLAQSAQDLQLPWRLGCL